MSVLTLRIYRHESTHDLMYVVVNPSMEGTKSYQIERGDFDPCYLSDIFTDYPTIDSVVIACNAAIPDSFWLYTRDFCNQRNVEFYDNNG